MSFRSRSSHLKKLKPVMVNSIKRNIAGVEETYTCEFQGMCTTCGEAITLVIGSDRANNLNKTRYYFTSENETLADETICKCRRRISETFTKITKDGW